MKLHLHIPCAFLFACAVVFAMSRPVTLNAVPGERIPEVMGTWKGEWINPGREQRHLQNEPELYAEVIGLGNDQFRIRFFPQLYRRARSLFETEAELRDGVIRFDRDDWQGEISAEGFRGESQQGGDAPIAFELSRYSLTPPNLGKAPPEGAIVLFDGSDLDAWEDGDGNAADWIITDDGILQIPRRRRGERHRSIRTRETFGDIQMHIEYRTPYFPSRRRQGRGNSGVFIQSVYEVQVLDSFGADGHWDDNGALYKVSPPRVNASLPPGQWQTFEIDFQAARFGPDGDLLSYPRMTVLHNGIPIVTDFELREHTRHTLEARQVPPISAPAPILLQEHGSGNPVQFRNIWVLPKD